MTEVSAATIKKTQDTLGTIIKKPVLTEKLLRKPPFKFLHDIITAVIKNTGFFGGLYSEEELQSENIKDRDSKIAFLQKAVDVVKISTKQEVKARPSKIVAGLEADKTNELLQAIAKAINRKIDTAEAVAQVKSGNVKSPEKKVAKGTKSPTKPTKAQVTDGSSQKPKKLTKQASTTKNAKDATNSDAKPKKKTENHAKVTKQDSKESIDGKQSKAKKPDGQKEKHRARDENHVPKTEVAKENDASDAIKSNELTNGVEEKNEVKVIEQVEAKPVPVQRQKSSAKEPDQEDDKLENAVVPNQINALETNDNVVTDDLPVRNSIENVPVESSKPRSSSVKKQDSNDLDKLPEKKSAEKRSAAEKVSIVSENLPQEKAPPPEKTAREKPIKEKAAAEKPIAKTSERSPIELPQKAIAEKVTKPGTALRSAALRPVSARPSAPRRRDRNIKQILHTENLIHESTDQSKSDKKNFLADFDDGDNIIITDIIQDNISTIDDVAPETIDNNTDGKQGHLVQQILETQTAILKADAKNDVAPSVPDENLVNDRKPVTRNMNELRKSVQKLSLYITPLGKMMEYFQEDVDAMQIELLMWQKAYTAAEADIRDEQRQTEELLEQFKYQLAEINNNIKEHMEQINNTTTNIIQNEEKINKLIANL